jgi:tripartite-type tricarboxylate transporter receptor subunit TctC
MAKLIIALFTVFLLQPALNAFAQSEKSVAEFYRNNRLIFITGYSAGGSFDLITRLIVRHITKYIPGNPSIIVQNIPGGGGRIGANYLFNVAKPDGLTIGHISGFLVLMQMLKEPGVQFDMQRYQWIGGMGIGPLLLTVKPSCLTLKPNSLEVWPNH